MNDLKCYHLKFCLLALQIIIEEGISEDFHLKFKKRTLDQSLILEDDEVFLMPRLIEIEIHQLSLSKSYILL